MQLVEKHLIKLNNPFYKECDSICFKTKNLYNTCLYIIRQAYIKDKTNLVFDLYNQVKHTEQYKDLPAKVSSSVILMVQKTFKSYFKASAEYYKNPSKFTGKPKLPKYLDSTEGRYIAAYTNQAISKKVFKKTNKIFLSKTGIEFKTKITDFKDINCIRIVPRQGYYVIEVVYTVPYTEKLNNNNRYCSIDLGINNLACMVSNVKDIQPIIFNGKPLKSINQYYNKKLAYLNSCVDKRNQNKKTKKINILNLKRTNKIDYFLHKCSKEIVKHCVSNNINTLVIGKNDLWKQEVNLKSKNNQKFVYIPHSRFISFIEYKCEMSGINVIKQEESFTSKASFLNLDYIPCYSKNYTEHQFSGYRKTRGQYKIKGSHQIINADVNGSFNILRKAIPNVFDNGIEGIRVYPKVLTLK